MVANICLHILLPLHRHGEMNTPTTATCTLTLVVTLPGLVGSVNYSSGEDKKVDSGLRIQIQLQLDLWERPYKSNPNHIHIGRF